MADLTHEEKLAWYRQHIKSRVFAMLAKPAALREREKQLSPDAISERFFLECVIQASWEGRHAATRWLIEFVGIVGYSHGKAVLSKSKNDEEHDFRINDLGGKLIEPLSDDAVKLAKLRRDINKATSHPTHASGHESITEERLKEAAAIIVAHLQKEIYTPAGENL